MGNGKCDGVVFSKGDVRESVNQAGRVSIAKREGKLRNDRLSKEMTCCERGGINSMKKMIHE